MVAGAFDDGDGAGVTHCETFARDAFEVRFAGDGAIENRIADDDVFRRFAARGFRLTNHDTAAREPLADIVVAVASELETDAARQERPETAAGRAFEAHDDGVFRQPRMAMSPRDFAGKHGADGAMDVAHLALEADRLAAFDGRRRRLDQVVIERGRQIVILLLAIVDRDAGLGLDRMQEPAEIDAFGLPMMDRF